LKSLTQRLIVISSTALLLLAGCTNATPKTTSTSSIPQVPEPYLGQMPPGNYAQPFAASIIPVSKLHTPPVFSPDGKEVYWKDSRFDTISMMKLENNSWTTPFQISLSVKLSDFRDPCLSPDGKKLFFISKSTLPFQSEAKENIWVAESYAGGWAEPKPLNEGINIHDLHWQLSVASNGNLYFASFDTGIQDIYCAKFVGGDYLSPIKLNININLEDASEWAPYVSPDETMLLFTRSGINTPDNYSIFLSVKDSDGNWGKPKRISRLGYNVLCPQLSLDKKYLFFLGPGISGEGGRTYWISADIINELLP
jgi:Tol biopolymer transport system component